MAEVTELIIAQRQALQAQAEQIEALERRVRELEAGKDLKPLSTAVVEIEQGAADDADQASGGRDFAVGRLPDDTIVRTGSFAGAITMPGTALSLRLGGFVQVDTLVDFEGMGSRYAFLARTIDPNINAPQTRMSARRTRFNIDVRGPSDLGQFRVFVEGDFDGDGGEEYLANGSSFRLRHAFGQLGPLYFGQYWSTMSDVNAFPEVLDTASPAGRVGTRQAGVRYLGRLGSSVQFRIGLEKPQGDFRGSGQAAVNKAPDLVSNIVLERPWGHIQLAGVGRLLAISTPVGDREAVGWGFNLTGRLNAPGGSSKDNLVFGLIGGRGLGRYFMEFAGAGYDASFRADTGAFGLIPVHGGYLGVQHWWSERVRTTATLGAAFSDLPVQSAPDAVDSVTTASINLLWNPIEPVTFGAEWQWGSSDRLNGVSTDGSRLQLLARHQF